MVPVSNAAPIWYSQLLSAFKDGNRNWAKHSVSRLTYNAIWQAATEHSGGEFLCRIIVIVEVDRSRHWTGGTHGKASKRTHLPAANILRPRILLNLGSFYDSTRGRSPRADSLSSHITSYRLVTSATRNKVYWYSRIWRCWPLGSCLCFIRKKIW